MLKIRAELCERIDELKAAIAYGSVSGLCDKASDVRHLAQRYEMRPVADLAWKLEGRLARGERGPSVISTQARMSSMRTKSASQKPSTGRDGANHQRAASHNA